MRACAIFRGRNILWVRAARVPVLVFAWDFHNSGSDELVEPISVASGIDDLAAVPAQGRCAEQRDQRSAGEFCRCSYIADLADGGMVADDTET